MEAKKKRTQRKNAKRRENNKAAGANRMATGQFFKKMFVLFLLCLRVHDNVFLLYVPVWIVYEQKSGYLISRSFLIALTFRY
jgi:hypothetical protein